MRLNTQVHLRRIGNRYMIVDSCTDQANMTNVFCLNASAGLLWQTFENTDFSIEELAECLCRHYGIKYLTALHDVEPMLEQWRQNGWIIMDNNNASK